MSRFKIDALIFISSLSLLMFYAQELMSINATLLDVYFVALMIFILDRKN